MPTNRKRIARHRHGAAVLSFKQKLELLIGDAHGSCFSSEVARREAWRAHRHHFSERNSRCWAARRYDDAGPPLWDPEGRCWDSARDFARPFRRRGDNDDAA
jgi:hypothetical protein